VPASPLADRVQRVRLLLETLNDPYPTARGALRSDSGPAASRYVPCETCRRSGWVKQRRLLILCLVCDGHGWRRREHDDEPWDAYLALPVSEAVQLPVESAARPSRDDGDEEPGYGWERLRDAYERRGSYREVRLRLEELSFSEPRRHHLIRIVLVEQEPRHVDVHDRLDIDLGVVQITLRMHNVRVPPWLLQHGQEETNAVIRALAAQGAKPGEIAARLGLATDTVKRTLRRARQRAPQGDGRKGADERRFERISRG
jgi:hypothetical protein